MGRRAGRNRSSSRAIRQRDHDAESALRPSLGHQLAVPIIAASAGTVIVRTTNVSISNPIPMTKPVCTMMEMLPNNSPNIEAAKMSPGPR